MLTRSKAQLELDWQRRCEEIERSQYEKCEQLVRHVTQTRDEVGADTKINCPHLQFVPSNIILPSLGADAVEG